MIGLTGGIGAGKSTAAQFFREAGIFVADLDAIGRELTEKDPGIQRAIDRLCGGGVLTKEGLDRKKVRDLIFAVPNIRQALEKILHPLILEKFESLLKTAAVEGHKIVLCEAALLVEGGYEKTMAGLIVVTAPWEVRKKRLMERDHVNATLADQILKAQAPEETKLQAATWVIENTWDKNDFKSKTLALMPALFARPPQ